MKVKPVRFFGPPPALTRGEAAIRLYSTRHRDVMAVPQKRPRAADTAGATTTHGGKP